MYYRDYSVKKFAKGGEIGEVNTEVTTIKRNIMGTTSMMLKIKGMKKPQDFIVYPISAEKFGKPIMIQSDTRFGYLDLSSGEGLMSQSHANGAYSHHFSMDKKVPFRISETDLQRIKQHIQNTAGSKVGSSVVLSDNSGAGMAKGGLTSDISFTIRDENDNLVESYLSPNELIEWAKDYAKELNENVNITNTKEAIKYIEKYQKNTKYKYLEVYSMAKGGVMASGGELRYKIKGKNFDEQIKNNREYKKLIDQVDANQNEENKFQKNFIDETARTGKIVKYKNEYYLKDYSHTGHLTSFPFLNDKMFLEAIKYLDRPQIKNIK